MSMLDDNDRRSALEEFAASSSGGKTGNDIAPAGMFAAPAERVFGAQKIAVKRDEGEIMATLSKLAAAAGDDWFYRFPVRTKVKNEATGEDEWKTDYIEGPSIKCANNVARLYGNCDLDCRVMDLGDSYMFYARFMDLETGYSLTRPFRQRKNQKTMKTDAGRAEDIVFQIGASKALRNVVNNALEFFTSFAMLEAKNSIITKVGQKLPEYRNRVKDRLAQLGVDLVRVERIRARTIDKWIAEDIALTIAEIQSINDGMARADETWPDPNAKPAPDEPEAGKPSLDKFANGNTQTSSPSGAPEPATKSAQGSGADTTGQPASGDANAPAKDQGNRSPDAGGSPGAGEAPPPPKTEAEYATYARAWIAAETDPDHGDKRWKEEKALRNACQVGGDMRDELGSEQAAKMTALRKAKG